MLLKPAGSKKKNFSVECSQNVEKKRHKDKLVQIHILLDTGDEKMHEIIKSEEIHCLTNGTVEWTC